MLSSVPSGRRRSDAVPPQLQVGTLLGVEVGTPTPLVRRCVRHNHRVWRLDLCGSLRFLPPFLGAHNYYRETTAAGKSDHAKTLKWAGPGPPVPDCGTSKTIWLKGGEWDQLLLLLLPELFAWPT